jgi:MOSC domain-containing protein YiiM/ferredoxin-NADP reductase
MGVVVSVNVGLPRDVAWRGKIVHTGIWKEPVAGRVIAGRLNLAGDGQGDLAGHGGEQRAVMVYQLDSYRYWARHLGRADLTPGIFGENFTVEGLADDEVCIGDRYRIGNAVFEVTQPRVTCYRVGLRLDTPEMPALLVSHRRPGFYFRVIEEGDVGAGDRIDKVADGPERMTVAEIDALLYSSAHPRDALQRAVRISALAPGWQRSMRSLLAADGDTGNAGLTALPTAPLSWLGFRFLKVVASSLEAADIRSFELASEDGATLPPALPGQYVAVKLHETPDAPAVVRNYSLCGAPGASTYRIAVKKEGLASGLLHDAVRPGDRLEVSAPRGVFTLERGVKPVVLLSAGVGMTPVLAMLHAMAASDAAAPRDVWWFHSARDGGHHAFAGLTRGLVASLHHGHHWIQYSRPGRDDRSGVDFDRTGRLSVSLLQELGVPQDADFYLCGPAQFLTDLRVGLQSWEIAPSSIHSEAFGAVSARTPGIRGADAQPPHPPDGPKGVGPLVTFARSGLAVPWDSRFDSLLEFAEACSVPVRWACRTGVCHNCESGLIDGQLRYAPEPLDPPARGNLLVCCAVPISAVSLDL